MNNYEQLTFQGGQYEMIKKHADKMQEYERRKQKLMLTCASCEELERELQKLTKELKV